LHYFCKSLNIYVRLPKGQHSNPCHGNCALVSVWYTPLVTTQSPNEILYVELSIHFDLMRQDLSALGTIYDISLLRFGHRLLVKQPPVLPDTDASGHGRNVCTFQQQDIPLQRHCKHYYTM